MAVFETLAEWADFAWLATLRAHRLEEMRRLDGEDAVEHTRNILQILETVAITIHPSLKNQLKTQRECLMKNIWEYYMELTLIHG